MMPVKRGVILRCPRGHVRAEVAGSFLRLKCRQCSSIDGQPVYHVWNTDTWTMVDPRHVVVIFDGETIHALTA